MTRKRLRKITQQLLLICYMLKILIHILNHENKIILLIVSSKKGWRCLTVKTII